MSSLLGSIFGGSSEEKETSNESLFVKSKALPERPQHKPVATPSQKKSKRDELEDTSDAKNDEDLKRQKRKKKRKSSSIDDSGGDTIDNEKNKEDSEKVETEKDQKDEERTIFVGNLSLTITRKTLASLFRDCGPVASCRIRSVPVAGVKLPKDQAGNQRMMKKVCVNTNQIDKTLTDTVQGYVVFKNLDDVAKALELNNKLDFDGMKLRVDRATPTVDPSRSVFVGNLPYGAKESTLQEHFEKGCLLEPGDVVGVRIVRDKETFQCKGFGYVLFREKNSVPTALKLHESTYMKKRIRVMVCGKRFKGKKGESSQPKQKFQNSEKTSVGAFRRIIAKQQKDALATNKRKRGEKKKNATVKKAGAGLVSKRAALDKKVEKKVKKLQKRASKGMGKNKR
jgi:nucleolar protein 12